MTGTDTPSLSAATPAADNAGRGDCYKVRLPWRVVWTPDYELAFQLATGVQTSEADVPHPEEDRITAFGPDPRTVECIYCGDAVSRSLIATHHADAHPRKRWMPAFYPEVYE